MSTMTLDVRDGVHVLTLTNNEKENAFTMDVIDEYHAQLDAAEAYEGNTALLITCEHEKTFSTGINLEWLMSQSPDSVSAFVNNLEKLYYRLTMLNMPTVTAINGNCYAGAAIMVSGCDFRFMRSDRGRFCYPEVNIKIPFTPMMQDLVDLLPNKHVLKEMTLLGRALTGSECLEANVVDGLFSQEDLQQKSLEFAKMVAEKDRSTYTQIKRQMRPNIERHRAAIYGE